MIYFGKKVGRFGKKQGRFGEKWGCFGKKWGRFDLLSFAYMHVAIIQHAQYNKLYLKNKGDSSESKIIDPLRY